MAATTVEISRRGQWVAVPSVTVDSSVVVVTGRWIRVASVLDENWAVNEIEDPARCIETLKRSHLHGARADLFTFAQKPPSTVPCYFYPVEWESVAAVQVSSFSEWWEKLPQATRKNVRRAQKRGVVVEVKELDDDLLRGIVEVQNDCAFRQGRPYYHYGKSLEQVKRDFSAFLDRSDFICAYFEDELIGFLQLVYRGDVASILQQTPKIRHSDKRPANAMIAKAVELCAEKGIRCLTYGLYNYQIESHISLREFKARNGFEELRIPRYYVPLTRWGKVCVRMKLYHSPFRVLPRSVIHFLACARAKLYAAIFSMSRHSSTPEPPNCVR